MKTLIKVITAATLALALQVSSSADGGAPSTLPDFSVTAPDGSAVKSSQLVQADKWLLIYIQADCGGCDSLLHAVQPVQKPEVLKKAVIIVGHISSDQVESLQTKYPDWAQASWYADTTATAFSQLKLTGMPVALGMRQGNIVWTLNAPSSGASYAKPTLLTWITTAH